jgi:hypothetical protein
VGAIVETESDKLVAEPSQGSHFFHNITTLGINYITVSSGGRRQVGLELADQRCRGLTMLLLLHMHGSRGR